MGLRSGRCKADVHRTSCAPIVPSLRVYGRVTRLAQRDQVTTIVRATFTQRQFVVDYFSRHENSTLKTHLTERMLRSLFVTDPLPCTTVSLLRRFISAILLVITITQLLMLFTEPLVCQLRASRIRAWMLRVPWHHSTFFPTEKAATVFCSVTALHLSLLPS